MKCTIFSCLIALFLSSCAPHYDMPYGVWLDEDGALMFDINPEYEYEGYHKGTYIVDSEAKDIYIATGIDKSFTVYDADAVDNRKTEGVSEDMWYFSARFEVKRDGRLYCIKNVSGEEIIFDKIEDYEVPKGKR